jgi:hypothetical protein
MRLAKLFIGAAVICLAMQSQTKAQSFTPLYPAAAFAPANFSGAGATLLGTIGLTSYYKCPQSGVTFTAPKTTTAAALKLRAAYTCASARFVANYGTAMNNSAYALAATNWFVINVNPLYGY